MTPKMFSTAHSNSIRCLKLMGFIFLSFVTTAQAQEEMNDGEGIFSDESGQISLTTLFKDATKEKLVKEDVVCTSEQFKKWQDSKTTNNVLYQEFLLWVAFERQKAKIKADVN
ncbi:MAG: hypothetical protein ACI97K_002131 [Glaciecola sp.]|jgi:hypothetical protein